MELPGAKESKLSARYTSSFYAASDLKKKREVAQLVQLNQEVMDGWFQIRANLFLFCGLFSLTPAGKVECT